MSRTFDVAFSESGQVFTVPVKSTAQASTETLLKRSIASRCGIPPSRQLLLSSTSEIVNRDTQFVLLMNTSRRTYLYLLPDSSSRSRSRSRHSSLRSTRSSSSSSGSGSDVTGSRPSSLPALSYFRSPFHLRSGTSIVRQEISDRIDVQFRALRIGIKYHQRTLRQSLSDFDKFVSQHVLNSDLLVSTTDADGVGNSSIGDGIGVGTTTDFGPLSGVSLTRQLTTRQAELGLIRRPWHFGRLISAEELDAWMLRRTEAMRRLRTRWGGQIREARGKIDMFLSRNPADCETDIFGLGLGRIGGSLSSSSTANENESENEGENDEEGGLLRSRSDALNEVRDLQLDKITTGGDANRPMTDRQHVSIGLDSTSTSESESPEVEGEGKRRKRSRRGGKGRGGRGHGRGRGRGARGRRRRKGSGSTGSGSGSSSRKRARTMSGSASPTATAAATSTSRRRSNSKTTLPSQVVREVVRGRQRSLSSSEDRSKFEASSSAILIRKNEEILSEFYANGIPTREFAQLVDFEIDARQILCPNEGDPYTLAMSTLGFLNWSILEIRRRRREARMEKEKREAFLAFLRDRFQIGDAIVESYFPQLCSTEVERDWPRKPVSVSSSPDSPTSGRGRKGRKTKKKTVVVDVGDLDVDESLEKRFVNLFQPDIAGMTALKAQTARLARECDTLRGELKSKIKLLSDQEEETDARIRESLSRLRALNSEERDEWKKQLDARDLRVTELESDLNKIKDSLDTQDVKKDELEERMLRAITDERTRSGSLHEKLETREDQIHDLKRRHAEQQYAWTVEKAELKQTLEDLTLTVEKLKRQKMQILLENNIALGGGMDALDETVSTNVRLTWANASLEEEVVALKQRTQVLDEENRLLRRKVESLSTGED